MLRYGSIFFRGDLQMLCQQRTQDNRQPGFQSYPGHADGIGALFCELHASLGRQASGGGGSTEPSGRGKQNWVVTNKQTNKNSMKNVVN